MAVGGIDDDAVHACVDQHERPLEALVAHRGGGGDAQATLGVLAGVGMERGLLDVLDRDEAHAAMVLIHHQQLLDAVLMQQAAGVILLDAFAHGDELLGHQLGDGLKGVVGEAHVAVGDDAAELGGLAAGAALDHGNAGNAMVAHECQRVGEGLVGENGDGIDHHAALVALDLAHFLGLFLGLQIAVDDADAARLGHGDGEARLGHRVHGGRDDGHVEGD